MSSGAVFQIIANEGRTDRLLLATSLLNQRIKDIQCARSRAGKADCWPTLVDIERTHVLFTNAHFKPYVAMAYEYRKVKVQNGNPAFGTSVTFSIPQIGDFFFDMVIRAAMSKASCPAQQTPAQLAAADPAGHPQYGDVKPVFHANTAAGGTSIFYRLVDYAGSLLATGGDGTTTAKTCAAGKDRPLGLGGVLDASYSNLVHLCEFPGNRLFKEVKFEVNESVLDKYDDTCSMMVQKYCVPPNKKVGYYKMHGQELPTECWSAPSPSISLRNSEDGFQILPANRPSILNAPTDVANPYAVFPTSARYLRQVLNGPQTPKVEQPALELLHKLHFWFNNDVRLAIPSVSIPYGQRYITASIAPKEQIYYEYPGCYVEQLITSTAVNNAGELTAGNSVAKYFPYMNPSTSGVDVSITDLELYINNIFVNPEVHDIYIRRIGFSLIRVHLYTSLTTTDADNGEKMLNQLKWPVEYIMCGIRPKWNISASNSYAWRDWHRLTKVDTGVMYNQRVTVPYVTTTAGGQGEVDAVYELAKHPMVDDKFVVEVPTVSTLKVVAHGVTLYDEYNTSFHNVYLPYHYGGANLNTPEDSGVFFINFCLYPGTYQPSGHFNISRAREFSLQWKTPYVTSAHPGDLIVVASAINFLLISDGSAVLRFST